MNQPQTALYWCKNEEGTFHKFLSTPEQAEQKLFALYDPEHRHTWKFGKVADLVYTETLDSI